MTTMSTTARRTDVKSEYSERAGFTRETIPHEGGGRIWAMTAGAVAPRQEPAAAGRREAPPGPRYRTTSTFLISSMPGPMTLMKYRPRVTLAPLLFVPSHVMP